MKNYFEKTVQCKNFLFPIGVTDTIDEIIYEDIDVDNGKERKLSENILKVKNIPQAFSAQLVRKVKL